MTVAPLAGAWIEIVSVVADIAKRIASLPSRERGLKSAHCKILPMERLSLPSRERGLKYQLSFFYLLSGVVAPLAGAWIEIKQVCILMMNRSCRSPRGSVD